MHTFAESDSGARWQFDGYRRTGRRGRSGLMSGARRSASLTARGCAFTLIELLVVIAIIAILAALILPSLSRGKAQAKRIACANNLHQMGLGLHMYLDDFHSYPYYLSTPGNPPNPAVLSSSWTELLQPYYPFYRRMLQMGPTNNNYQCPVFDFVKWDGVGDGSHNNSYAYNRWGGDYGGARPGSRIFLGLGNTWEWPKAWIPAISESQVKTPSEMFAIADARVGRPASDAHWFGQDYMDWLSWGENEIIIPRQHGKGYNVLCCDGHVEFLAREVLLSLRRTAQRWNNDHEPHPELWQPSTWAEP